jgi:hypothetical protein
MKLLKILYRTSKYLFLLFVVFTFLFNAKAQSGFSSNWGHRKEIQFKELEKYFIQPDMIYAPFAFWFWDTKLDPQHAAKMAEEMSRKRLNPGYAHPRKGLPHEEWLSSLWFKSFQSALNKAEEADAYLGYCDEYWWPSGQADGRVLKAHPDLEAVSLRWDIQSYSGKKQVKIPESFFTVAAQIADSTTNIFNISSPNIKIRSSSLQVIGSGNPFTWQVPEGKWRIYIFNKYHHPAHGGKVNYLDRRLPKAFIEIAHEPYAERFGKRMGKSIPGVFVDNEGDYGYKLCWSKDLASEYEEEKGSNIRRWMPLMFEEDVEGLWPKARWDWYDIVSGLYTDNYLGTVSRWLKSHGMYDISNLWEADVGLKMQALTVGNFFQAQRAVTMPGNDCLVKRGLDVFGFKETQSVTEFEGKRFQSEIMGVAGWQMSPVLVKKVTNSVINWGVSHIVPHGINLSRELQQIPYPPDWFTSNPYWRYFHLWTDFARRASYINSHGHLVPDVLLVNPMSSVWPFLGGEVLNADSTAYGRAGGTKYEKTLSHIEEGYEKAIRDLTRNRIEYLIADDHYMDRMNLKPNGRLVTGSFEFKSLVLPPLVFLPLKTAQKIVDFAEAGGYVYTLGELPVGSTDNGLNDNEMKTLMSHLQALPTVKKAKEGVSQLVKEKVPWMTPQIEFETGEFKMINQHRQIDGKDFFWLVNNTDLPQECTLKIRDVKGLASKWDCETGIKETLTSQPTSSSSRIHLKFQPYEAYWVVFDPRNPAKKNNIRESEQNFYSIIATLNGLWQVRIDTTVQPVQTWPRLAAPEDLLKNNGELKMLSSWLDWDLDRFTGYVDYENTFNSPVSQERLILDLGEVKYTVEVWLNGNRVGARLWPPFEFDIGDYVKEGENKIKVRIGNLICNGIQQYFDRGMARKGWGWDELEPEDFDAGLYGPVVVKMQK